MASKQLLAAVGQSQLIQTWEKLFAIYDIHIGQMLLTRADIEDRERFLNARDTLHALLDNRIIPVINENDAVATAEIKVGDNDNLSALMAILVQADRLENRKQWLFTAPSAGVLTIDEGAQSAVLIQHKSLLLAGIVSVSGRFSRGEVVRIRNAQGKDIALGMPRYNSDALELIKGKQSQDIEQQLGYEYGAVAIHRDDMIVL